ncbi:MAG: 50S ribosomal protein L2, partial [Candidatus Aenigmatarchaeota archaeon]
MGKNLRQQRRGRGTPRYLSPGHRFLGKPTYRNVHGKGKIVDIVHAPGRKTPVAVARFGTENKLLIAGSDMYTGQEVEMLPISGIPEGSKIFNVELAPGDGGRLCRSAGTFATLISKEQNKCVVLMPSKQKKVLSLKCRAMIGSAAGGGASEKPFMKAGTKYYTMRTLNRMWPHTSGVSMNPVDHPFGGKTKTGKHRTVSKHMPPGKKVGSISPRRTGK